MKMFIDGCEVSLEDLKQKLDNLDCGEYNGSTFEIIALDHISSDGDMYFETDRYCIYG